MRTSSWILIFITLPLALTIWFCKAVKAVATGARVTPADQGFPMLAMFGCIIAGGAMMGILGTVLAR